MTTPVPEKVPTSLEEVYQNGIKAITFKYEYDHIINNKYLPREAHKDIFVLSNVKEIFDQRRGLNRTYAFLLLSDKLHFYLQQQKELHPSEKLFALTKMCFGCYFTHFSIRDDSPFKESLDLFIIKIYMTGLLNKWMDNAIYEGFKSGMILRIKSKYSGSFEQLKLDDLKVGWWFYVFAIVNAIIFFSCEVFRNRVFGRIRNTVEMQSSSTQNTYTIFSFRN